MSESGSCFDFKSPFLWQVLSSKLISHAVHEHAEDTLTTLSKKAQDILRGTVKDLMKRDKEAAYVFHVMNFDLKQVCCIVV